MSFYGSVYYQLVDTFYKTVIKNSGRNNTSFITPGDSPLVNQAVGRKGVIELDSGNKWINFSESIDGEDSAAYKIWHGKPDTASTHVNNGFKPLNLTTEDLANRTVSEDNETVILLKDYDKFETYETKYDDAGHIAGAIKKVYRLPKAEINDKVERLENLVGDNANKVLPDIEDKTLFGYVEENSADIKNLEKNVGEWNKQCKGYQTPSISEFIGNFNTFIGDEDNYLSYGEEWRSLTDVIGVSADLDKITIDDNTPDSIIDGIKKLTASIAKLTNTVDTNKTVAEDANLGLTALIGKPIDAQVDIYEHLRTIYGNTTGEVSDSLVTLAERVLQLEKKDASLDEDIKDINDTLEWTSNDSVQTEITAIKETMSWTSSNSIQKEISEIQKDLSWTRENSVLTDMAILEGRATNLETHATNSEKDIKDLQDRAKSIEDAATELTKRVNDHYESQNSENTKLHEADSKLDDRIDEVVTAIGVLPEETTVVQLVSETASTINDTIGTVPEKSNVMKELTDSTAHLQGQIDTLVSNLGSVTDGTNAYQLINKNTNDISTINTTIGSIESGSTVSGLIATNSRLISEQGLAILKNSQDIETINKDFLKSADAELTYLKTDEASTTYVPLTVLGDWENPDNTIAAKITSLEGAVDGVNNLIGDATQIDEGKTIIDLLLEIKAEITEIKTVMQDLHPDTPLFEEVITPEEPESSEDEGTGTE